jgi:hypothetical protein
MALANQLRERSSAIVDRWLRDTLATYSDDAAVAFKRNKDPFTNPVGHALRAGTRAAVEALCDGKDADEVCSGLDGVIKIRAVQEFTPSQALSFVFLLKQAVRSELRAEDNDSSFSGELVELEKRIDQVALRAFDVFSGHRERVYELRINEVKRSVGDWIERMNRRAPTPRAESVNLETSNPEKSNLETSEGSEPQRGDGQ